MGVVLQKERENEKERERERGGSTALVKRLGGGVGGVARGAGGEGVGGEGGSKGGEDRGVGREDTWWGRGISGTESRLSKYRADSRDGGGEEG